jgi:hypothetical protein
MTAWQADALREMFRISHRSKLRVFLGKIIIASILIPTLDEFRGALLNLAKGQIKRTAV